MDFKKESLYTLRLDQEEINNLVKALTTLEQRDELTTPIQIILNHIVLHYTK